MNVSLVLIQLIPTALPNILGASLKCSGNTLKSHMSKKRTFICCSSDNTTLQLSSPA